MNQEILQEKVQLNNVFLLFNVGEEGDCIDPMKCTETLPN